MDDEMTSGKRKMSTRLLVFKGLVGLLILFNLFFWYQLIEALTSSYKPNSIVPLPGWLGSVYILIWLWICVNPVLVVIILIVRPKNRVTHQQEDVLNGEASMGNEKID